MCSDATGRAKIGDFGLATQIQNRIKVDRFQSTEDDGSYVIFYQMDIQ